MATSPRGRSTAALVCLPRSKAEARAPDRRGLRRGRARRAGDRRRAEDRWRSTPCIATCAPASHHRDRCPRRMARSSPFPPAPAFEDWARASRVTADGFVTLPGVFSADGPDRGSALLAAALPAKLPGRIVDLGAGWGYLARAILAREGVQAARPGRGRGRRAGLCARATSPIRARASTGPMRPRFAARRACWMPWSCNPPFHIGRAADPALGAAFIRAAAAHARTRAASSGWSPTVTCPMTPSCPRRFREVEEIGGDGGLSRDPCRAPRPGAALTPSPEHDMSLSDRRQDRHRHRLRQRHRPGHRAAFRGHRART